MNVTQNRGGVPLDALDPSSCPSYEMPREAVLLATLPHGQTVRGLAAAPDLGCLACAGGKGAGALTIWWPDPKGKEPKASQGATSTAGRKPGLMSRRVSALF